MTTLEGIREQKKGEAAKYTIDAVAQVIGVSAPTYRKLESNPSSITYAQAEKLSSFFGCKVSDIFLDRKDSWSYVKGANHELAN